MNVVSNTTPLINFAAIGRLDILATLFGQLTVPTQVITELSEKRERFPTLSDLANSDLLQPTTAQNQLLLQTVQRDLDAGEAAAVVVALEQNADLILLDEMAGRELAQFYRLRVLGSIGCLIEAKHRAIIPAVRPLLVAMQHDARFWISKSLFQRVLKTVDES